MRPALAEDLPAAVALLGFLSSHQAGWRVFAPRPTFEREVLERWRRALEDPDLLHLVAELDGRVVGMGLGEVQRPSSFSDELALEISNVVVLPEDRRRGVARAIVRRLADFARDRGVRRMTVKVFAPNHEALGFWRSLGFEDRLVQLTAPVDPEGRGGGPRA